MSRLGRGKLPDGALVAGADPVGAGALLDRIPAGLMLPVVGAAADHQGGLDPDDLLAQLEAEALEAGCHLSMWAVACQT